MRWSWFMPYHHFVIKRIEERKQREERERAFYENGSVLLEKLIASCNAKPIPIRTFSPQQLRQAANNFSSIHLNWFWYKGSLEGRIVLIKHLEDWADLAINDLVISAQMSAHSNVLKPIGCCLHTPCPILVYEFAANGLLADRIYVSRVTELQHQPMVWERRLKIARQISHAISYLHIAFQRPVIHLYIQLHTIFLDEHDVPKLSHFNFSVSIPEGETDVEDYNNIRKVRFSAPEVKATEDGERGAGLQQQIQAVVDLALACTNEDPQRRPTMVDVTKQLRRIERFTQTGEELGGNLQNLKLNESLEKHASASFKRNVSNDEIEEVKEASERPLEA